jgi:hypothetical protein
MAEENHTSLRKRLGRRRRHAIEPHSHRHDVCGSGLAAETVASIACVARCRRKLDARIGVEAAEAIDAVIDARPRARPETVWCEVHGPEDDRASTAETTCRNPARAGKRIETEPRIDARRDGRDDWIDRVRGRWSQRHPHDLLGDVARLVRRDEMAAPLLSTEWMEDRDDADVERHEVVTESLSGAVLKEPARLDDERVSQRGYRSSWPCSPPRSA